MNVVQINAEPRENFGKKGAKITRSQGKIPAILYSKNGVKHFSTTHNAVKTIVFTPYFKIAEIELEGNTHRALLKVIDFHPVTDAIEHMDFQELVDGHEIKTNIPIGYEGESPGEKSGGVFIKNLRTLKVKTIPENLVEELVVDISSLVLGSSVRVRDIKVPEGMEILVNGNIPVASVEVPRALKEDEEELDEDVAEDGEDEEVTESKEE